MGTFSESKLHKTQYISMTKHENDRKGLCHGELSAFSFQVLLDFLHFIS